MHGTMKAKFCYFTQNVTPIHIHMSLCQFLIVCLKTEKSNILIVPVYLLTTYTISDFLLVNQLLRVNISSKLNRNFDCFLTHANNSLILLLVISTLSHLLCTSANKHTKISWFISGLFEIIIFSCS